MASEPVQELAPVAIVGLGPMGQAMARVLLGAGHPVTVWNRTAARANGVVAAGAVRASTPAEALDAPLVILSLTDYQAMYDILGKVDPARLRGVTLANLSSDTPDRTRAAAAWANERGAAFLVGGVMVPAPMVGSGAAYTYYSGPADVFATHEATLRRLGDARYVGDDPGLAQLLYQAQLNVFLTSLAGLLHATALVGANSMLAGTFVPQALETLAAIPDMLGDGEELGARIDDGQHPGDLSTVTMMGATAAHIVESSRAADIDLELPSAVQSLYERAIALGHGSDDWTSLIDVIDKRRRSG